MKCPLCDTTLPDGAASCTRCDWVRHEEKPVDVRDQMAGILSLVPGLGHLYKGHVVLGGLIFFLIGPGVLLLSLVLAPATLGLSMGVSLLFVLGVAVHAFLAADKRAETIAAARAWDAGHGDGGH